MKVNPWGMLLDYRCGNQRLTARDAPARIRWAIIAVFSTLMPLIYKDLQRMARRYLRQQRPNHTLKTTALINEAYMRLVANRDELGRTGPTSTA
jgi:hypothetical protein